MAKKYTKSEIEGMIKNLKEKEKKARSKWGKAVLQDAQWLLENVIEGYDEPYELSEKLVLNGAKSWKDFSYGGCAYVANIDIAKHYATPSQFKQLEKKDFEISENETLCDVQARALRQAWWAIRDEMNGTTEFSMSLCEFEEKKGNSNFDIDNTKNNNGMKLEIYNQKGELVNTFTDKDSCIARLIEMLWAKSEKIEKVKMTSKMVEGEEIATFTEHFSNGYKYVLSGVPMNHGYINATKIVNSNNFSVKNGLKYRKTKGQGKDSYKGKKSNFSIDYICEETCDLADFPAWSGAKDRLDEIIELGIEDEAEDYIREMFYGETPTDTQINDLLWFDMDDWIEEHREHKDNFKIFNIEWDESDIEDAKENDIELPTELELEDIEIENRDYVDDYLSDAIYDEVGYSPNSFEYESESGNFSIHELSAQHDARKSFYGKAQVDVDDKTGVQTLYSYGTKVAQYNPKTNKFTAYPEAKYSATTKRHVREFMKQNGVPASEFSIIDDTKDVLRATGKLAGNIVKNTTDKGGLLMF